MKLTLAKNEICLGNWNYATTKLSKFKSRQHKLILTNKRVILNSEDSSLNTMSEMSLESVTGVKSQYTKIRKTSYLIIMYFCLIASVGFAGLAIFAPEKAMAHMSRTAFLIPAGIALVATLIFLILYFKSTQVRFKIDIFNDAHIKNALQISVCNYLGRSKKAKHREARIIVGAAEAEAICENFGKLAIINKNELLMPVSPFNRV